MRDCGLRQRKGAPIADAEEPYMEGCMRVCMSDWSLRQRKGAPCCGREVVALGGRAVPLDVGAHVPSEGGLEQFRPRLSCSEPL
jgi:hypothetical protein